ncbi:MAG: response regulator, partial [bacterium]
VLLVVDDDPDVLLLVGARLRAAGYEVVTAEDGETAIASTLREQPVMVLLDLGLPKMDGFEVCRRLKADPVTCGIPIMVFSAKSQQVDKDRASKFGADGYMAKPFDPGVLLTEIANLIGKKGDNTPWHEKS